jgi:lactase-phlorizin hydrolase
MVNCYRCDLAIQRPIPGTWARPVPSAFRVILNWMKQEYNNVPVYITENGTVDKAGNLDDIHRIYYYKHYLNQMLKGTL